MLYIGIDPGKNTGFAVWDSSQKKLIEVATYPIHIALGVVEAYQVRTDNNICVVFEDARQRKFYTGNVSAKAQGAGSIKRDCTIWEDFCTDKGISFRAVPPMKGATKWSEEYFRKITGWQGRTSNHARDAVVLVLGRK